MIVCFLNFIFNRATVYICTCTSMRCRVSNLFILFICFFLDVIGCKHCFCKKLFLLFYIVTSAPPTPLPNTHTHTHKKKKKKKEKKTASPAEQDNMKKKKELQIEVFLNG